MANKKLNKEIDRMFLGMGVTGSVALTKPRRGGWIIKAIIILVSIAIVLGFVYWFITRPNLTLANQLPSDASFYAAISLPQNEKWYSELLFWKKESTPNKDTARLFQKFNLFTWDNLTFTQDILPIFYGTLEAGLLPNGGAVLSMTLKDKEKWFDLVGISQETYQNSTIEMQYPLTGWWPDFTATKDAWAWYIEDDMLYVLSSASVRQKLGAFGSFAEKLNIPIFANYLAFLYSNDSSIFADNIYTKAIKENVSYPLIISAKQGNGLIRWQDGFEAKISTSDMDNSRIKTLEYIPSNLSIYINNFESLYKKLGQNFVPIFDTLKGLYSTDISDISQIIGEKDVLVSFKDDWMVLIESEVETQETIFELLKNIGASFFAFSHPITIERELTDGTVMTELRADIDGLEWEEIEWLYNGTNITLESLQGKGEINGYFIGSVPNMGIVLGSSLEYLQETLNILKENYVKPPSCDLSGFSESAIKISHDFISSDAYLNGIIDYFLVGSSNNGNVAGCIVLKSE